MNLDANEELAGRTPGARAAAARARAAQAPELALLVEGGPTLWRAFAMAGLVDEVYCYRAGSGDPSAGIAAANRDIAALRPAHGFGLAETRQSGADGLYVFYRK